MAPMDCTAPVREESQVESVGVSGTSVVSFIEVGKALGEAGWRIRSRGVKFKMPVKQAGGGVGTAGGCVGLRFRGRAGEADVKMKNLGVPRLARGPSCSNGLRGAWSPGFEGQRGGESSGRGDRGQQVGGAGEPAP